MIEQNIFSNSNKQQIYYIFAGINGSGKTSLYGVLKDAIDLGERVSIDDMVKEMGDWHDPLLQIKAARIAMKKLDACIEEGKTFHQETTLPGETIIRFAEKAEKCGFLVVMYYVGIDSLDIAIDRVHKRVEKGGHGIDDAVIAKRYRDIRTYLAKLIPYCNEVYFYDNTRRFRQVAVLCDGELVDVDSDLPEWMKELDELGVINLI